MSGVDKITEMIIEQAKKQREEILNQARRQSAKILEDAKIKVQERQTLFWESAQKEAQSFKERLISLAELEVKKEILKAKREIIDKAIQTALEELSNLPEEEYINILVKMIISAADDGEGEIILSKTDKETIGSRLLEKVNKELKYKGIEPKLRISSEYMSSSSGGFILRKYQIDINCTFDSIAKIKRDDLENMIAETLLS